MSVHQLARSGLLLVTAILLQACSTGSTVSNAKALPNWRGVWFAEGLEADISGFLPGSDLGLDKYKLVSESAPWNDTGRAKYRALFVNGVSGGGTTGPGWGYPVMMNGSAPLEFIITPEETVIVNSYRDMRRVYTDGRALPAEEDRVPTTWGDSVGRWEGDTLIIETVSVRYPPRYFPYSPPLSDRARYIERIRKVGPDRIESEMTIEDPENFERPWVLNLAYTRATGLDRIVYDAFDNDRSKLEDGLFTIQPTAP